MIYMYMKSFTVIVKKRKCESQLPARKHDKWQQNYDYLSSVN